MAGRKRRTPEQARLEILHAAEELLRKQGLSGLTVVEVAKACGMSHATVIHHFGNTAGMRQALVTFMTDRLLRDIIQTMQQNPEIEPGKVLRLLYDTLSEGGHAKLLAWMSVGGDELTGGLVVSERILELFSELVPVLANRLPAHLNQERAAKRMMFLVATAAIGYGVAGPVLPAVIGMSQEDAKHFPEWLGHQIAYLMDHEA